MLVKIAGRLVGEDQRRLVGQRARNGDALLLAARQLRRAMVEPLRQPENAEELVGALARRVGLGIAHELGNDHILARSEFGQQMVELIDEAQ
jgi:hypothetical protein